MFSHEDTTSSRAKMLEHAQSEPPLLQSADQLCAGTVDEHP